jgi:hypothetical protein
MFRSLEKGTSVLRYIILRKNFKRLKYWIPALKQS